MQIIIRITSNEIKETHELGLEVCLLSSALFCAIFSSLILTIISTQLSGELHGVTLISLIEQGPVAPYGPSEPHNGVLVWGKSLRSNSEFRLCSARRHGMFLMISIPQAQGADWPDIRPYGIC
jgi:hypothetical protein